MSGYLTLVSDYGRDMSLGSYTWSKITLQKYLVYHCIYMHYYNHEYHKMFKNKNDIFYNFYIYYIIYSLRKLFTIYSWPTSLNGRHFTIKYWQNQTKQKYVA